MLQQLVTQFISSGAANDTIAQVAQTTGLEQDKAAEAVAATAEGAAEASTSEGGLAGLAGSLLGGGGGGGGLGGLASSMLGGGAAPAAAGGVPAQLQQTVTQMVAQKTGLSPQIAGAVVAVALPKVLEFFQSK